MVRRSSSGWSLIFSGWTKAVLANYKVEFEVPSKVVHVNQLTLDHYYWKTANRITMTIRGVDMDIAPINPPTTTVSVSLSCHMYAWHRSHHRHQPMMNQLQRSSSVWFRDESGDYIFYLLDVDPEWVNTGDVAIRWNGFLQ